MSYLVVTTYAESHWESHARRCVESFTKFWPKEVALRTYTDGQLEEQSDWLLDFKRRNAGREVKNFRYDAVRFAHKVAAIELAYHRTDRDVLVWMDADCVTHSEVTVEWLDSLRGRGDFALLKRARTYPECGFMMFSRPRCNHLVNRVADMYREDTLYGLPEWHDSYIFDYVQRQLSEWGALKVVSLSGNAENTGHPFVNGPLGAKMDHLKGKRKVEGRSRQRDLKINRGERYWA